ncbi:MAG: PEP-CTERM sorting domain-containing protein [Gemmatimonadaceae bacterium]
MQFSTNSAIRTVRRVVTGGVLAFSVVAPAGLSAQTVTFEDWNYMGLCNFNGGDGITSSGGFSFGGLIALDLINYQNQCGRNFKTGYINLPYSNGNEVIGLGSGTSYLNRNRAFVLKSLVAGAGWINTTRLTLSFYLNAVLQGTSVLTLNVFQNGSNPYTDLFAGAADFIGFTPEYTGADYFDSKFESCIGASQGCQQHQYETYFLDNLVFAEVPPPPPVVAPSVVTPEPSTIGLMALGMLAIAGAARRRRKR